MFGRLTLSAFQHGFIEMTANFGMILLGLTVVGLLTYFRRWKWFWKEWLTTLDPKRIGVMYFVVTLLMLFKGVTDALMMRLQQALSVGDSFGYLTPDHFQQVFTAHGTTMIFFVGMGIVFGLMNLLVPLQIGTRDVAFPFLNSLSFWLYAVGFLLVNISLLIGEFSATGWVAYPPLSGIDYSPGVGMDYWIWSVQIAGAGSLLSGVNFLATIIKMRCPGMTLMKMPIMMWAILATTILIIFAFPILTATLTMLALDRLLDMHFFTADFGGNPMMYVNLIWAWGHPEVYILVLPAFGIFSEIVPVFSRKRLFGYLSMVVAIAIITVLSFIVWLHHFFTMGSDANVNAFFGIMTMLIAVPTGVKIFNWIFTMFRGRVRLATPMLWFLGFVVTFTLGGMAGVLLSIAPVDYQTHNSLFLIAHFHSVIIGGVVFGFFAGFTFWFPKFTGFLLNERLGRYAFWSWMIGFLLAFMPLYVLGLMGATRRIDHYETATGFQPLFIVALFGVGLIILGMIFQFLQLVVSIRDRKQHLDLTGDPWDARTLEWSTSSPPPFYNYAIIPTVSSSEGFWDMKQGEHRASSPPPYEEIHLPQNSGMGLIMGIFSFIFGFAVIWHMFWLAALGIVGLIASLCYRMAEKETNFWVPVEEIKQIERARAERSHA